MTTVIAKFAEISARYTLALVDLWGCVHNGKAIYPEAEAALLQFRRDGGCVILVTNAPRPRDGVAARLADMGLSRDAYDGIATSGDAAQQGMVLGAVGRQVWHLGPAKDDDFFTNLPDLAEQHGEIQRVAFDDAEGIVCTGLFDELTETPEDYRGKFLAAKARGLKLLCANPDIVVDLGDQRLYCAGALAHLYDEMGGESLYFGKPHPPIYDLARRIAAGQGVTGSADTTICVGDGINTDILGGMGEDMDTLFITGGLSAHAFGPDVENPDPGLLEAWLKDQRAMPTHAMGRFR